MSAAGSSVQTWRSSMTGSQGDAALAALKSATNKVAEDLHGDAFNAGTLTRIDAPCFVRNMDAGRGRVLVVQVSVFWLSAENAARLEAEYEA